MKRKKELRGSELVWLNQRFSQSSLNFFVLFFLHDRSSDSCASCWWEISNVCVSCLRDLLHTYFCTCFTQTKRNKGGNNKGSTSLNTEEPKSFYYYYLLIINIFLYLVFSLCICYFLFTYLFNGSPNSLSFRVTQTRHMVKMQCKLGLGLSPF